MSFPKMRLDKVCRITMGQAPSGDSYNFDGNGLALIAGAGDFGKETPEPKKYTTAAGKRSEEGEIILCIRATIGDLNWSDKEYCLGRGVAGLFGHKDKLDQKYLWHWLKNVAPLLKSKGKGATFLQVTKEDICSLEIALPPLSEQRRIASILDQADELRQKRQQAIEKLDQLLQATFIDMFGDPVSNPKGWNNCKFENVIEFVTYGLTVRPEYHEQGIPLISAREIRTGELNYDSSPKISKVDFEKLSEKAKPKQNDILFSKTGSIGHCAIVKDQRDFAVTQNAARVVPRVDVCNPMFLLYFMRTNYFYNLANKEAKGNAVKDLQLGIMKSFQVYLPPMELQDKWAIFAALIEKQKNKLETSNEEVSNLFKSLQNQAFNGTL
ncbi:restriction endonuclease subunit S [Acinetobacter variabilis]|uniref:restriction endonuclease subunit S n=1 Tax=Acinetobacter variabilis TaxID=70346 RepID=UPI0030F87C4A